MTVEKPVPHVGYEIAYPQATKLLQRASKLTALQQSSSHIFCEGLALLCCCHLLVAGLHVTGDRVSAEKLLAQLCAIHLQRSARGGGQRYALPSVCASLCSQSSVPSIAARALCLHAHCCQLILQGRFTSSWSSFSPSVQHARRTATHSALVLHQGAPWWWLAMAASSPRRPFRLS